MECEYACYAVAKGSNSHFCTNKNCLFLFLFPFISFFVHCFTIWVLAFKLHRFSTSRYMYHDELVYVISGSSMTRILNSISCPLFVLVDLTLDRAVVRCTRQLTGRGGGCCIEHLTTPRAHVLPHSGVSILVDQCGSDDSYRSTEVMSYDSTARSFQMAQL